MAKPKTKTQSASQENVPVEDQAKLTKTKKKGRPAKSKQVTEKPTQEEVSGDDAVDLVEVEEDTQEVDEEAEVTEENSKPAAAPGSRTKQKRTGLTFPIIKMRETLRKGKTTALSRYLLDNSYVFLSRQLPADQQQQVERSHLPDRCAGVPRCRGSGARWGHRQAWQEDQDRSEAHHAGHPQ